MQQLVPGVQPIETAHVAPVDAPQAISVDEGGSEGLPEYLVERGGYSVRLAESFGQRGKASMLIQRMYSWRGYRAEAVTPPPHSRNRVMLEASCGQHLFGTLTLGLDSEEGLLADTLYQSEVNALRALGCKLCEMSKLAVDPQYGSKSVLASLFHVAYIFVRIIHKATDVLIEVNPHHAAFYQRRLGFRQIGGIRICPRVNAPAVLLHLELAYMDTQISKHAGAHGTKEKSLYPYFFSSCEAEDLVGRIAQAA